MKIRHVTLIAALALFFTIFQNLALWLHLKQLLTLSSEPVNSLFVATIPLFIFALNVVLFTLLTWPWLAKPLCTLLLLTSTLVTYAMVNFGQYFNYGMMFNVFETNQSEALSYLSWSLAVWIVVLALLPTGILIRAKIVYPKSFWRLIAQKLTLVVLSVAMVAMIAGGFYKDYAALVRNHSEIKSLINPTNYLSAAARYWKFRLYEQELPFQSLGEDAHRAHTIDLAQKDVHYHPNVMVIVVGETSRAMNYSLNGYVRQTNPKLEQQAVISFQHMASCGTATAVSLPCMFSLMTHHNYDATKARHQEGLLDVLKHAGVDVSWTDNDGGCKGVCDRVEHMVISPSSDPSLCQHDTCYDQVLLKGLAEKVQHAKQDTVIVLHMIGSHGPTYYRRYPEAFERFTPSCNTAEIQNCTPQALLNTYDNTIVYTDYVLSEIIDILKRFPQRNSAMLYLSDHGESLGENGVYLHGLPYAIAPQEQTSVPLILWLSPQYLQAQGIKRQCLTQKAQQDAFSQDNLFHTVLGMMQVESRVYQSSLDILASCEH